MGGCRCSYKNCVRATKNSEKDFHFFHYPVRDPQRCTQWITNAKKSNFNDLPEDQLRNKVVCQLHFEQRCFTNVSRKRLVHNAVPTLDAGSEEPPKEMNVQVLQSNSEGTVFTVDTNLMKSDVGDVKSYVLQNGNLIPTHMPSDINKAGVYKVNTDEFLVTTTSGEKWNGEDVNNKRIKQGNTEKIVNNGSSGFFESLHEGNDAEVDSNNSNNIFVEQEFWPESTETIALYEERDPLSMQDKSVVVVSSANKPVTQNVKVVEPTPELIPNNTESDPILIDDAPEVDDLTKTVERHSQEIASLKRMLNVKMRKSIGRKRTANTQIIDSLRSLIPSTLLGAVSLHLFKRNSNFTKAEKRFLTSVFKASPDVYNTLVNDCNWKLPNPNIVKNLLSSN